MFVRNWTLLNNSVLLKIKNKGLTRHFCRFSLVGLGTDNLRSITDDKKSQCIGFYIVGVITCWLCRQKICPVENGRDRYIGCTYIKIQMNLIDNLVLMCIVSFFCEFKSNMLVWKLFPKKIFLCHSLIKNQNYELYNKLYSILINPECI